jgi:transcriptional regulator with XRE-family HTH domain
MKTFGEILREKRTEYGLTMEELANKIGVSYSAISLWERGHRIPNIYLACDLAEVFNCTVDDLCGRTEIRGKWEVFGLSNPKCSVCHKSNYEQTTYCPHCGAKMRGGARNV